MREIEQIFYLSLEFQKYFHVTSVCSSCKVKDKTGNLVPTSESPTPFLRKISCFLDFTMGEVFSSLVKKEGR